MSAMSRLGESSLALLEKDEHATRVASFLGRFIRSCCFHGRAGFLC
jgi:hypothetical protein